MWNLDKWDGLARTTYVLDGSVVTQGTVDGMKTVTGTGAVTVPATPPQVRLSVGATAGTAQLTFPRTISSADVAAVIVNVQGITITGLRPTFRAQLAQAGRRAGVLFDEMGAHLTAESQQATLMNGNMTYSADGACGVLADFATGKIRGHYGYSVGELGFIPDGSWTVLLSNETKDTPNYKNHTLGFRSASLTVIWNLPGGEHVASSGGVVPADTAAANRAEAAATRAEAVTTDLDQAMRTAVAEADALQWDAAISALNSAS